MRFRSGDEAFGMTGRVGGHQGSLAEYAAVDAELLALKPAYLGMREASVLPLVFITAWEGLVDRMAVRAGQKVLVLGGAGGVGRMAVQIARSFGAEAFAAVHRFGHVVSPLGWGTHALAPLSFRAATYSGVFTLLPLLIGEGRAHHGAILAEATRLAEAGQLLPQLDPHRFKLRSVGDAYRMIDDEIALGKLAIDIEEGTGP